jgi:predicted molibdopterin-dependent oxidoreductase YjgC
MSYERLEKLDGLQWPCPTEDHPGSLFLHGRLWQEPAEGPLAPFVPTEFAPPVDTLSDEFPIRLTTGRRLDSFNTGVQTGGYTSPLRRGERSTCTRTTRRCSTWWRESRAHRVAARRDRGAGAPR